MNIDRTLLFNALGAAALAAALLLAPVRLRGQEPEPVPPTSPPSSQEPMLDDSIEAAEDELPQVDRKRKLVRWNEYEGPWITLKFGMAGMVEGAAYSQDDDNKEQLGQLDTTYKVRDFRVLFSGRFPKSKREITWKTGFMWDGAQEKWLVRETGFIVAVPEMSGHLFIGRTKEGSSLTKHMVGYAVWGLERSPMHDATLPIMADGIRWMGYRPKQHLQWNLGYFDQTITGSRTAPPQDRQAVARVAWLPFQSLEEGELLHIGATFRYADPQDGNLQVRARPETNPAPYFVDTGTFHAEHTMMIAPEIYYRRNSFLIGSEYMFMRADSPEKGNPLFHGGDIVATYQFTGEARKYSTRGGVFGFLAPRTSVFQGGKGAWEGILRLSYIDTDDGEIQGGKNWRLSPLLAWHLSDEIRWTFAYGYDVLDRFGKKGTTHIFQSRISFMF